MPRRFKPVAPSRVVVSLAEYTNTINGNENLGFLSEKYGFTPVNPPLQNLPVSHKAWDEIAAELPKLYWSGGIRRVVMQLPVLDASAGSIPDKYLCRAATVVGILAHAYYWLQPYTPETLPDNLQLPWQQIASRLQRDKPFLSYNDLILYNWMLKDPTMPRSLSNMQLLVPTVGERVEEIFYLAQLEMAVLAAPIIGLVIKAQEAIMQKNTTKLKRELDLIKMHVENVINAFIQVNPNAYSKSFVDPIAWAKCVAPLAVNWGRDTKGPSGLSSPIFHLLDLFLGRSFFETQYGIDQIYYRHIHVFFVRNFLASVQKISLRHYIEHAKDRVLKNIFNQLVDSYCGEKGLLNVHRLKVYGYLNVAFKAGRLFTVGGTQAANLFMAREWQTVNQGLEAARQERLAGANLVPITARIKSMESLATVGKDQPGIFNIILDLNKVGIDYNAGDRCGVLPSNSDHLIEKTLQALNATGFEIVSLNKEWREAAQYRLGTALAPASLSLREILKYGRIRPLLRSVAKKFYSISSTHHLKKIIDDHSEDQWEFWDVIILLQKNNYDVSRLWKADAWEAENICYLVPPERFRLYSVASSPKSMPINKELHLTIGQLQYTSLDVLGENILRHGTASNFIIEAAESTQKVPIQILKPTLFHLPKNAGSPIVMFAGGLGIAPFRGFITQRMLENDSGENWLFFATKSTNQFYYKNEIANWITDNKVQVHIGFSREEMQVQIIKTSPGKKLLLKPGARQSIKDLMLRDDTKKALWDLLQSQKEGGKEAFFYVSGQGGFANVVFDGLKTIIANNAPISVSDKRKYATDFMRFLVADKRYMQDIFTTSAPTGMTENSSLSVFNISEIAQHNNEKDGYWMILDDQVYDLSEFLHLHPGGGTIIKAYAGMNATREFQEVDHHLNAAINAMREMYKIGIVKPIDLGHIGAITLLDEKLEYVELDRLYNAWLEYLFLIIEIQNALLNNNAFYLYNKDKSKKNISFLPNFINVTVGLHFNFVSDILKTVSSKHLENLWAMVIGFFDTNENFDTLKYEMRKLEFDPETAVANLMSIASSPLDHALQNRVYDSCDAIIENNLTLIEDIKSILLEGLRFFEQHQSEVIKVGHQFVTIIQNIIVVINIYSKRSI